MYPAVLLLALSVSEPPSNSNLIIRPDAFNTLVNPNCSHCIDESKRRSGELRDDDRVLCWTRGKYDGGAIPIRFFLSPYRVISDTYGTFVYDPDAGYARAFPASLKYRFHGWRNGVMVMKHEDGTLFSCLSGVAFDGPRKGERLPFWPTVVADWGWYVKQYPGGVAYHMYEKYKPVELPTTANGDSVKTRGKIDPRLPAEEMVLGVDRTNTRSTHRAYPIAEVAKYGKFAAVNDRFECGEKVVIFWQSATNTAVAYAPVAEKRKPTTQLGVEGELLESKPELQIEADGKSDAAPFVDKVTGSRFDITGRCVDGELKGWTLKAMPAVTCKWFAWSAEYPTTTVRGK